MSSAAPPLAAGSGTEKALSASGPAGGNAAGTGMALVGDRVGEGRALGVLVGGAVATAGPRTVISTVAGADVRKPSDTRYVKLSAPANVGSGV